MRLLFTMGDGDYSGCTRQIVRHSARSIILKNSTVAMVHSLLHDYYKFPGGGIEPGEDPVGAMIRETREESGLTVRPETVREYGIVSRRQMQADGALFVQDNFYYLCEAEDAIQPQALDAYEAAEGYRLEFVVPETVLEKNRQAQVTPFEQGMLERECRVLELLKEEGYLEGVHPEFCVNTKLA